MVHSSTKSRTFESKAQRALLLSKPVVARTSRHLYLPSRCKSAWPARGQSRCSQASLDTQNPQLPCPSPLRSTSHEVLMGNRHIRCVDLQREVSRAGRRTGDMKQSSTTTMKRQPNPSLKREIWPLSDCPRLPNRVLRNQGSSWDWGGWFLLLTASLATVGRPFFISALGG